MAATLLKLPERDIKDVPRALRALADRIEAGDFGEAHNLAWVIDCGNSEIAVGLAGPAAEIGVTAHFLMALGMRKIEAL